MAQERARKDAPSTAPPELRWVLLGLTAAVAFICWPMWPPLLLAAWTAALVRPLLVRLEPRLRGRRRAAAALALMLSITVLVPLGLVSLGVFSGTRDLWETVTTTSSARTALETIAAGGSEATRPALPTSFAALMALAERYGAQAVTVLTGVAGATARALFGLFVYLAAAFVFLVDGAAVWAWFKNHSPLPPPQMDRLASAFHETGRGLLLGVGLAAGTQGIVATVVYASLGVPRWWALGPITGIASVIPVAGSSLVWGPIAIGLALTGHPVKAAILALLGVGLISTIDNLLRPTYTRLGALKLPTLVLFVSIFGGVLTVGPWGAVLGPLAVRLWVEAIEIRGDMAHRDAA